MFRFLTKHPEHTIQKSFNGNMEIKSQQFKTEFVDRGNTSAKLLDIIMCDINLVQVTLLPFIREI